jgi:eukaryotic-like serine/threonine-protein kinase
LASAVRRAADGHYEMVIRNAVPQSSAGAEVDELADAVDALLADLRDKEALIAMTARSAPTASSDSPATAETPRRRRTIGESVGAIGAVPRIGARQGLVLAAGDTLANRYRIVALLGAGGMGLVYRAMDRSLGETVAVKLLRPEVFAADPNAFDRVKDELRLARRITHRNVVRTHDMGESDGVPFFTMEFVDGTSLADVIHARGALPPSAVISIAKQLLRALAAAHAEGVVHGDLKPQNLLIGSNGVLKVSDFGVARLIRDPRRKGASGDASARQLTGATIGTPEYMAPEQLIGGPATMLTDIYAAGIVVHECLTGGTPYRADTPMAFFAHKLVPSSDVDTAAARTGAHPLTVTDPRYSGALERLIASMTAPDAEQRARSAAALLRSFTALG